MTFPCRFDFASSCPKSAAPVDNQSTRRRLSFTLPLLAGITLLLSTCSQQGEETPPPEDGAQSRLSFSTSDKDGALMVLIPEGDFFMGDPAGEEVHYDENPCRTIHLDAFWIDCYEVTNRLYKRFVHETGHRAPFVDTDWARPYNWINNTHPPGTDDFPVVLVSWEDAAAYAAWAGKRLPTEAEWEKAARGGLVKNHYPWGNAIDEKRANYFTSITATNKLERVGSFPANPYGLYDVAGNVWEWCSDWYGKTYYRGAPDSNPRGPEQGLYRVFRGGSWVNRGEQLRCSERARNVPDHRSYIIGFRCARSADGKESDAQNGRNSGGNKRRM
jgi:formylglycine-generating enzyme required for sulfatase activity